MKKRYVFILVLVIIVLACLGYYFRYQYTIVTNDGIDVMYRTNIYTKDTEKFDENLVRWLDETDVLRNKLNAQIEYMNKELELIEENLISYNKSLDFYVSLKDETNANTYNKLGDVDKLFVDGSDTTAKKYTRERASEISQEIISIEDKREKILEDLTDLELKLKGME